MEKGEERERKAGRGKRERERKGVKEVRERREGQEEGRVLGF